ncbi:unnamed protein product [Acanthosepion pharaonis]|uniref:Uncharacterized protein n=1 Tax=Acanthosepion pharaonis TaxID=158019 RepID=A0A812DQW1_ACAPH|nr:unnamed protein product [Sepia pharaonis]
MTSNSGGGLGGPLLWGERGPESPQTPPPLFPGRTGGPRGGKGGVRGAPPAKGNFLRRWGAAARGAGVGGPAIFLCPGKQEPPTRARIKPPPFWGNPGFYTPKRRSPRGGRTPLGVWKGKTPIAGIIMTFPRGPGKPVFFKRAFQGAGGKQRFLGAGSRATPGGGPRSGDPPPFRGRGGRPPLFLGGPPTPFGGSPPYTGWLRGPPGLPPPGGGPNHKKFSPARGVSPPFPKTQKRSAPHERRGQKNPNGREGARSREPRGPPKKGGPPPPGNGKRLCQPGVGTGFPVSPKGGPGVSPEFLGFKPFPPAEPPGFPPLFKAGGPVGHRLGRSRLLNLPA